ncbi:hypothetical protein [Halomonas hibernica]|uniref:hypothetical protein n=1 Tax=Halomonas hibernica TaxID=2591147 RepID=UPI001555BDEC|nr:hypothetical protein [Halomonas hibernica]
MLECYLTGSIIKAHKDDDKGMDASLEHVIPNSLGGQVKSSKILSLEANQILNEDIDKNFNKIFSSLVSRLNIKRDRKSSQNFLATHENYGVDVIYKNGKYFPKKPFFDKNKLTIYADSIKNGENYKKYLLKQETIKESDRVKIFDDLAGAFNAPFSLSNEVFKRGFGKISAGFAAINGISRNNMKSVIDLGNNCIKRNVILSPYLPTQDAEGSFEENKHKSPNYPVHSLVLCGNKESRFLYCYVELFSAFQFYVLLDDDYEGEDIYKSYIYDLINAKEIEYQDYAKSIPSSSNLFNILPVYRYIDKSMFVALTHIKKDDIKFYCHRNYHALEAFTNYYFISEKAKHLQRKRA